ncbi:ABC transporter ATP-binding protein [Rhodopseudomonas palustris]|uniref:ABC transporter ATP-binding protein n=1 Tax=Rhodopseudomonas palustris TaxID=1076 RepID=A0A418VNH7_RHOPL|nr:ABC transporter ATP-binding protein [Rhodopseudomonas palustris]RJF77792.1 ABC transporter ATP-binding protein [Rhodopseudomonas palustris]
MTAPLLSIQNVSVRFGGLVALDSVALDLAPGAIQAVIGPNGAGKSTLLNVVTGIYTASDGGILFEGERLDGASPHAINRRGIARTFQNTELFGEMSALENVLIGLDRYYAYGGITAAWQGRRYRDIEKTARGEAEQLLALVGLAGDEHTAAAALPFGKQRRLEIARALATRPRLLLLDEPAAGLRAAEIDALNRILLDLRSQRGISILLIDHVMPLVMAVSDWITVLNFGRKIAEGTPQTVRGSPEVIAAYLGEKAAHAFGA